MFAAPSHRIKCFQLQFLNRGGSLGVSGWSLDVSGWSLTVNGWSLGVCGWSLTVNEWSLDVSGWSLTVNGWSLGICGWSLTVNGWGLGVSGCWWVESRSLWVWSVCLWVWSVWAPERDHIKCASLVFIRSCRVSRWVRENPVWLLLRGNCSGPEHQLSNCFQNIDSSLNM